MIGLYDHQAPQAVLSSRPELAAKEAGMTKLRVGIVGADAQGQGWAPVAHFPALRALPEFEIAALCTTRAETARAAAQRYGVAEALHDYRALVARPDIDIVSVVVRAPNHHAVVEAALAAGKHVYCEWPLGASTAEAAVMARGARDAGVRTAVGLQARCDPALRYARDLVRDGYVGEPLAVTLAMLTANAPERPSSKSWEAKLAGGVSALTIRGMHSLDALCMCVSEIAEVATRVATQVKQWRVAGTDDYMSVEVPDNVLVAGALADGALLSAHIGTLPATAPGFRLEIHGSKGTLHATTPGAPQRDENRLQGAQGRGPLAPMAVPASYRDDIPAEVPAGPPNNVARLYRRLAHAIRTGDAVDPDFEHALRRHELIDAITRASREGRVVTIAG